MSFDVSQLWSRKTIKYHWGLNCPQRLTLSGKIIIRDQYQLTSQAKYASIRKRGFHFKTSTNSILRLERETTKAKLCATYYTSHLIKPGTHKNGATIYFMLLIEHRPFSLPARIEDATHPANRSSFFRLFPLLMEELMELCTTQADSDGIITGYPLYYSTIRRIEKSPSMDFIDGGSAHPACRVESWQTYPCQVTNHQSCRGQLLTSTIDLSLFHD